MIANDRTASTGPSKKANRQRMDLGSEVSVAEKMRENLTWASNVFENMAGAKRNWDPIDLAAESQEVLAVLERFEKRMSKAYGFSSPLVAAVIVRFFGANYCRDSFSDDLEREWEVALSISDESEDMPMDEQNAR